MGVYQCQNMGCPNGVGSSFEMDEGEENFYASMGYSSPKSCPNCRSWKKAQSEKYEITCEACGNTRIITPQRRINYHKKLGAWVDPTLCKQCEKDPKREYLERYRADSDLQWLELRRRGSKTYTSRKEKIVARISDYGDKLSSIVTQPEPFDILEDGEVYKTLPDLRKNKQRIVTAEKNAFTHIADPFHHSETKLGTNDGQTLILMSSEICRETDPQTVSQFQDTESGYLVKRDNITGQTVIIKEYDSPPPPYMLVTTFQKSDSAVINTVTKGKWRPSVR